MLGSDLIGFHTYNYERHFFSSVRRLLGYDINFNQINLRSRIVLADTFPMGIDYDRFHEAGIKQQQKSINNKFNIPKIPCFLLLETTWNNASKYNTQDYLKMFVYVI